MLDRVALLAVPCGPEWEIMNQTLCLVQRLPSKAFFFFLKQYTSSLSFPPIEKSVSTQWRPTNLSMPGLSRIIPHICCINCHFINFIVRRSFAVNWSKMWLPLQFFFSGVPSMPFVHRGKDHVTRLHVTTSAVLLDSVLCCSLFLLCK